MRSRAELEALVEEHTQRYFMDKYARSRRRVGLTKLLDWLESVEDSKIEALTWQQCWERVEATADWQAAAGALTPQERCTLSVAVQTLMLEGVIRPSYAWLLDTAQHQLYEKLRLTTEKEDFDRVLATVADATISGASLKQAQIVLGKIMVHMGKHLTEITTADVLELAAAVKASGRNACGVRVAHQLLRQAGIITDPPLTSGYTHRLHKPSIAELVDRQEIACTAIRDLLVAYLTERTVALDYPSASQLTSRLAKMFWRDIERHHPGIASLDLPRPVVEAWRKRQEVLPSGQPRKDVTELFMAVRSFYLDLAQWAVADPARWQRYVCPSPISAADIRAYRKALLHRQARMHERTRTLAALLPPFLAHVRSYRVVARQLLTTATACAHGETFLLDGQTYERVVSPHRAGRTTLGSSPVMVRHRDAPTDRLINCHDREEEAFWAWAVIEVLRLTGVRVEELVELTHLSIQRVTMADGQRVLLLQIAPSKRDRERVLPICPERAHVLATIVTRIRNTAGIVPVVERFDHLEKTMSAPLPYLFQRQWRSQGSVMNPGTIGTLIEKASRRAELASKDGPSCIFTPHDFRRLFATEVVNGGLPLHIAAKLLGHLDLNTTKGYVAVYAEEVIRQYQAHLTRRRVLRAAAEYREPTDQEWEEFAAHFRHRKMALGDCYRPYGTDCPHEHACVRCPMLRMDPAQLPRLIQIEQNTHTLLAEAKQQGWEGEVRGLEETLHHLGEKKAQVERVMARRDGSSTATQAFPEAVQR
jgi:site-specific recombinase XerD